MRKRIRNKKGQEEMVGFVLIVVVVAIIMVVFLGIFIRSSKSQDYKLQSVDVHQFLTSLMEYTTDCSLTYEGDYADMSELIAECYANPGKKCLSGVTDCQALNSTLKGILDASWIVGENSAYTGYVFNSTYQENLTSFIVKKQAISVLKGNCTGKSFRGDEVFFSNPPGKIVSSFRVCF